METTSEVFDKVFENMEKNMLNEENGDYVNQEKSLKIVIVEVKR